jgi:TRAF3-interacting protein 1
MVDSSVTEATREAINGIIRKPKLSDKLLNKPPFRFLHDIVLNVGAETGFGNGLFEGDELSGSSVQGKENKCKYLQKIVNCVGIALGEVIDVRVGKIVAGLEAENTCQFLQCLARAATDGGVDSAEAVRRTLDGEQMGEGPAARKGDSAGGKMAEADDHREERARQKREAEAAEEEAHQQREERRAARDEEERRAARDEEERRAARDEEDRRAAQDEEERRRGAQKEDARRRAADAEAATDAGGKFGDDSGGGGAMPLPDLTGNWEDTRDIMEQIIQKPRMQEKLLKKPPFRYLHDIFMAVLRATNFLDGLYEGEEMNSKAIGDKQSKIDFLEKAVLCVGHFYGTALEVQARKIVAGMEADLTNKFLQALGHAALSGAGSDEAVQKTLNGDEISSGGGGVRAPSDKSAPTRDDSGFSEQRTKPTSAKKERPVEKPSSRQPSETSTPLEGKTGESIPEPGQRKKLNRPFTARRRPPQIKENTVDSKNEEVQRHTTATIMREGDDSDSDDDVAAAAGAPGLASDLAAKIEQDDGPKNKLIREIMDDEEKKKEADKKAQEAREDASAGGGKTEETGHVKIRMGRLGSKKKKKNREDKKSSSRPDSGKNRAADPGGGMSGDQLEFLRESIQTLCQSVNPLAKCMEYVSDDIAQMTKESDEWRSMHRDKASDAGGKEEEKDEAIRDLEDRRNELDDKIDEQKVKINSVKATIARNDQRIKDLLRMVISVQ